MNRFWRLLGFRPCVPRLPDDWDSTALYFQSDAVVELTLVDRVRALISGKISVAILHQIEPAPVRWVSVSGHSVLPPGFTAQSVPTERPRGFMMAGHK